MRKGTPDFILIGDHHLIQVDLIVNVYKSSDVNDNKFMDIQILGQENYGAKRIQFVTREELDAEFDRIVELLTK